MRRAFKLELSEARHMVAAAIRKSEDIGVLETVCVVDEGGYPLVLERMDGARITGPQIAWNKAFTAAGHKRSTHLFNQAPNGPALPGNEAFGIQWSFDGKFAILLEDSRSWWMTRWWAASGSAAATASRIRNAALQACRRYRSCCAVTGSS